MAPTVPKFGLTLSEGADGTAGAVSSSLVAAKHQKMVGEYKVSPNFGGMLCCNPARGKITELVGADGDLVSLNVGRAADTTQTAKPMVPLKVKRPVDVAKAVGIIPSDDNDGLLDLKIAPAAKPTAKPIFAPPPYEGQNLDIDRHNRLDGLNRLNKIQDLARQAQGVFSSMSLMVQWAQQAHWLKGLPDLRVQWLDGWDVATALATKPTSRLIVALPPYKGQDPDIDRRNKLDGLDRLDKLPGGSA
jgi:hypothetical protein